MTDNFQLIRHTANQLRSYGVVITADEHFDKQNNRCAIFKVSHYKGVPVIDTNHFILTMDECLAIRQSKSVAEEYCMLMTGHISTQVHGVQDGFAESLKYIDPYA